MASSKKIGGFEQYEIESAADTLIKAEEIRVNAKLFPLAMRMVKKKAAAADKAATIRHKLEAAFPDKRRPSRSQ